MSSRNKFNGNKLRLARLLSGMTQPQLGELVSTSRQFIHQLESEVKQPADDVLNVLCEVLHVKHNFFFTPIDNEVKPEQCHFRKRRTTPVNLANRALAFSSIFEQLVSYIRKHLELPIPNFPILNSPSENYDNIEIEKAAEECRKLWGLGLDAPISNMTRALERAGVVITQYSGVSEKIDALSLNRKFPIIVRNDAKKSVCRLRFDLGHECGHFVLHDGVETGDRITESEADKFSSAFLFPRIAFANEFPDMKSRRLDWKLIYQLKVRWGMSARAIIYRAHYLDLITAQQYRSANVWLNKSKQTKVERYDDEISPETPELLPNAIELMKNELGISFQHIASKLSIDQKLLSDITGIIPSNEDHLKNVVPL